MAKKKQDNSKPAKWSKINDKKLKELFDQGTRNRGINSEDLGTQAIHQVIDTHFPD
jgi:hypothetical protein